MEDLFTNDIQFCEGDETCRPYAVITVMWKQDIYLVKLTLEDYLKLESYQGGRIIAIPNENCLHLSIRFKNRTTGLLSAAYGYKKGWGVTYLNRDKTDLRRENVKLTRRPQPEPRRKVGGVYGHKRNSSQYFNLHQGQPESDI